MTDKTIPEVIYADKELSDLEQLWSEMKGDTAWMPVAKHQESITRCIERVEGLKFGFKGGGELCSR